MKKTIATAVASLAVMATITAHAETVNFTDIEGHWARNQIRLAVQEGYVDGYPDGTFKPDQNVSRVEFMKLVIDALKFKKQDAAGDWYQPYINTAVANGLHQSDEFASDQLTQPITREEMARIAVRATGEANYDTKKWMYLATSKGIIQGMDNMGTLGEDRPTTRAQAITVIERIMKIKKGETIPLDKYAKYAVSRAEINWHKTNIYTMAPEYFGWGVKYKREFKADSLRFESEKGFSEIEKYVVVDMADPEDPFRGDIPDNMTWIVRNGLDRIKTQDVPLNTYAFLSYNHYHVKTDTDISYFRFSHLTTLPFKVNGNSLDEKGNLRDTVSYAPLATDGSGAILWGNTRLKTGEYDTKIITGQLVPKMAGIVGESFAVYREPAVELGETSNPMPVFSSEIDHSLGE